MRKNTKEKLDMALPPPSPVPAPAPAPVANTASAVPAPAPVSVNAGVSAPSQAAPGMFNRLKSLVGLSGGRRSRRRNSIKKGGKARKSRRVSRKSHRVSRKNKGRKSHSRRH